MSEPSKELIELCARSLYGMTYPGPLEREAVRRTFRAAHDAGLIVYRDEYERVVAERDAAETRHAAAVRRLVDLGAWGNDESGVMIAAPSPETGGSTLPLYRR